jgi:hypothetical protein
MEVVTHSENCVRKSEMDKLPTFAQRLAYYIKYNKYGEATFNVSCRTRIECPCDDQYFGIVSPYKQPQTLETMFKPCLGCVYCGGCTSNDFEIIEKIDNITGYACRQCFEMVLNFCKHPFYEVGLCLDESRSRILAASLCLLRLVKIKDIRRLIIEKIITGLCPHWLSIKN